MKKSDSSGENKMLLKDYVRMGALPADVAEILREALIDKESILVVGGSYAGKTTFCTAMLDTLAEEKPDTRMLIVEDVPELKCALRHSILVRPGMSPLNEVIDKERPDRICFGEVRRGGDALELLKAWRDAYPGGLCTVHADSALQGLTRLEQLIKEVSYSAESTGPVLIGEAIHIVVHMVLKRTGRRVQEVIRVHQYDPVTQEFVFEVLYSDCGQ